MKINKLFKNPADKAESENDKLSECDDLGFVSDSDEDFRSGEFINSLNQLTEDDIELSDAAKKKTGVSVSEWVRRVMFVFFTAMFVVSCVMLIQNLIDKQKGEEIYASLEAEFFSDGFSMDVSAVFRPDDGEVSYLSEDRESTVMPNMSESMNGAETEYADDSPTVKKEYNEELELIRAKLASLAQKNEDLYGWITVEGTNINYPIVQGEDNDYYLDHAYTGDYLPIGSIFADYRNSDTIMKNYNTVLYGHNITGGTMFHDVTKFLDEDYFNEKLIVIYTLDGIFYYEPFSIYDTRYDYQYFRTGFTSGEDFVAFAEEVRDNSKLHKDVEFTDTDRILTLSTCTNGAYYARYALHAKLVKTITD